MQMPSISPWSMHQRARCQTSLLPISGSAVPCVLSDVPHKQLGCLGLSGPATVPHNLCQRTWQYTVRFERHPFHDQLGCIFLQMSSSTLGTSLVRESEQVSLPEHNDHRCANWIHIPAILDLLQAPSAPFPSKI